MRDWSREAVITGMGVACHLGDDLDAMQLMLRQGQGRPFVHWDWAVEKKARCQLIGRYEGDVSDEALGIDKKQSRFFGRNARLALKAARTAIAQAGIEPQPAALIVGSGTGDVEANLLIQRRIDKTGDARKVGSTVIPRIMASTVSANLVNVLRTQGPSMSATAACAGGAYNLIFAAQLIEQGFVDSAIAGGVEARDVHFHAGFDAMRAYNGGDNETPERASRPYAADRSGFIFGEGAGIMVLESRSSAEARGANILGSLRGYGMSSDGLGKMVAPSPEGAARALEGALRHSELTTADIGYVNTHGTSTPLGDVSEVKALRQVFGDHHVAYSSTKGYTGHTISGAGAIEAVFSMLMLRGGWLAPCIHAQPLDPSLVDFAPVVAPTDSDARFALSNSFGFGGTNATLALAREVHS
jgi:3-oxoacyl-[acyl-carrier-protein] synthase I